MERINRKEEYLGTTKAELDHYMGNKIGGILMGMDLNQREGDEVLLKENFQKSLDEFIEGMEEIIQGIENGSFKESGNITRKIIQEFRDEAKNIHDATDENAIRALYEKYRSIRKLDKKNEKEK